MVEQLQLVIDKLKKENEDLRKKLIARAYTRHEKLETADETPPVEKA